jgi:hypothetical protein
MATKPKDLIRNENDYVLNYVKLVDFKGNEYDFTGHFVEFSFEESLFETFLHGAMFVSDAVDYPTLLPMVGEERLKISFTRQNEKVPLGSDGELLPPIEFDMPIYLMDGKRQESGSGKHQVYNLFYTSDEIFNNLNTKLFKALKNQKYSDIVQMIYDNHLKKSKPIEIEPTKNTVDYCIQNEHPVRAINKIAKRCVSEEDNGFFYVFYEDRDKFNFVTLGKLFQQKPVAKLTYEIKNIMKNTEGLSHKTREIEKDMYNVSNYQQQGTYDVLGSAISGEAASSLLTVDPIVRKYSFTDFDLRKEFDKFKHLEKSKPWTDANKMFVNPRANLAMVVTDTPQTSNEYVTSKEPGIKSYFPEDFFLHRQSQKKQMLSSIITTTVSGDPRIKAGDIIEFAIPEHLGKTSASNPEEKDKYMQGKYLVLSVAHIVKYGEYKMNLELIRDTVYSDITHRDPVKEYKNIY